MPVWVYLYGGKLLNGDASYERVNPQLLVESGIIAVTVNYRSGPLGIWNIHCYYALSFMLHTDSISFIYVYCCNHINLVQLISGFLTTEDGVIPANLALRDQHMALRWVKENIKFFNGDPSKVVFAGHSSGAFLVSHHLMSSKSKGLTYHS